MRKKIYTSNFNKHGNHPDAVGIAGKSPDFFKGKEYKKLAPTWEIYSQYKQTGDIDQYILDYCKYIATKNFNDVDILNGKILLCYEGYNHNLSLEKNIYNNKTFCHRHWAAAHLSNFFGFHFYELKKDELPIFKVIIAGSRTFNDYNLLKEQLDFLFQNKKITHKIIIIHGCALGADSLGEQYAMENNLEIVAMPALCNIFGKSAGYKRNVQMAEEADACVVFWDGISKGSKHMIEISENMGLNLKIIYTGR